MASMTDEGVSIIVQSASRLRDVRRTRERPHPRGWDTKDAANVVNKNGGVFAFE